MLYEIVRLSKKEIELSVVCTLNICRRAYYFLRFLNLIIFIDSMSGKLGGTKITKGSKMSVD